MFFLNIQTKYIKAPYLLIILALALILPQDLLATVNIESIRKDVEKKGLHTSAGFSIAYTGGNTDVTSHKIRLRSDYRADSYRAFLAASLKRGEKNDARYMNKGFVHLRGMKPLTRIFTAEAFLQKEYNDFTLLKDRELIGAGLRILMAGSTEEDEAGNPFRLYLGLGAMLEEETIDYVPEEKSSRTRATNYLSGHWQAKEGVSLSGTLYYQPRISDSSDYRILFDGGFSFDLTKKLAFTIAVHYRHDSDPPLGVEDYDIEVTNGISLDF